MATIEITSDPNRMDVATIHGFLSGTYWAQGRTREQVAQTIRHSVPFGLFLDGQQTGFLRVVSDQTVFAYLMDVFVLPEYRGNGYARRLLSHAMDDDRFTDVSTWLLKTKDAHGLYERLGFVVVPDAERYMVRTGKL
ncbi:MAG: GNAT family N-acetyltransferase [Planctomycetota bacterium]